MTVSQILVTKTFNIYKQTNLRAVTIALNYNFEHEFLAVDTRRAVMNNSDAILTRFRDLLFVRRMEEQTNSETDIFTREIFL